MRLVAILFLMFSLVLRATVCGTPDPKEAQEWADVIFEGTALSVEMVGPIMQGRTIVTLSVSGVSKGRDVGDKVIIYTTVNDHVFLPGRTYVVFAENIKAKVWLKGLQGNQLPKPNDPVLTTWGCSRTEEIVPVKADPEQSPTQITQ